MNEACQSSDVLFTAGQNTQWLPPYIVDGRALGLESPLLKHELIRMTRERYAKQLRIATMMGEIAMQDSPTALQVSDEVIPEQPHVVEVEVKESATSRMVGNLAAFTYHPRQTLIKDDRAYDVTVDAPAVHTWQIQTLKNSAEVALQSAARVQHEAAQLNKMDSDYEGQKYRKDRLRQSFLRAYETAAIGLARLTGWSRRSI